MKYVFTDRDTALTDALSRYARIAVAGAPNTGKSKLVARVVTDRPIVETDTWKREPWDAQPELVIAACAQLDRFVVEGVQVPRALRKGLQVDCLLWLVKPVADQSKRQVATIPVLVIP